MTAVLAGGAANALSAARTLWRMGVPVDILDDGVSGSTVRFSRARRRILPTEAEDDVVAQWRKQLLTECEPSVVLPCSDHGLELIATHRAELQAAGHRPIEAADDVLLALLDKATTYELARRVGVPAPRTMTLRDRADLAQLGDFLFPCAVKPVNSHVFARRFRPLAKGAVVRDPDDVAVIAGPALDEGIAMLVTEIVEGTDECCSYYTYITPDGVPLTHFTKRKLRQYPTRFGLGTYHMTQWNPEAAELGLRFFQGVGLRGIGNVEFKRDARDGVLKIIESNPRITNANELVRASGIDLVRLAYCRLVDLPSPPLDSFREDLGLWFPVDDLRALRDYRADGELSVAGWARTLLHDQVHPELDWGDLRPSVATLTRRSARLVRRGVERLGIATRRENRGRDIYALDAPALDAASGPCAPGQEHRWRVGVVVPAHNAAATLDAALASVAAQSIAPAEVVVVDDGSTDATAAVAATWCDRLPLHVERLPGNGGPGKARHIGVVCTTTPMLAFLDADDVWFPDHLESCLRVYARTPGVVAARGIRWYPGVGIGRAPLRSGEPDPPAEGQLDWIVRQHSFGTHVVMAREVYEQVGGFDPTMEGVEDWDLWIRAARAGVPLRRTTSPSFLYRQHEHNLSLSVERIGQAGLRMLERLAEDTAGNGDGSKLEGALRESRARIALNIAYARLDAGRSDDARPWGFRAVGGPVDITVRGAVVALAPQWSSKLRATLRERRDRATARPG
jgi:predicted ATP-grasp superfamily ATP-dependent carboligase